MKPDVFNLKKRKQFAAVAEELGLPTPKHACCEATSSSECGSLLPRAADAEPGELLDTLAESTQDSNSFPGDSLSSTEMILNESFQKRDSHDEASTSWANSRSVTSGNDSLSLGSRILSIKDDDDMEEYQIPQQDDTGWHDVDRLEECYYKDCQQKAGEELGEFLSSSGMNANMYVLSSERWIADQEAEMARRKPTIDQEFEQYFSTLML